MKKPNRSFLLAMLLFFLINLVFYIGLQKDFPDEPHDLTVVKDHLYLRYPVYFVGEDRIVKDFITIDHIWRDRSSNAIQCYFAQAELPYESRGDQILQIDIDKLTVTADRIYVYTKKAAFQDSHLNNENFYYYLMSFINTLTDGSRTRPVSFIFDEKAEAPLLYGVDMNKTFLFDENIVHSNYTQVEEFMRSFFVELHDGEYSLAYRKLSRELKDEYSLPTFSTAFKSYVFHRNSEFPWDFLVEKEGDQYKVTVIYRNVAETIKELWYLQEVNGRFYISYSQDLFYNLP